MTREEAQKKAYERYPDDFGPCDKPSIYDDARTLRIQREAYIAGLLDGSSEKPNNHEGLDEAACKYEKERPYKDHVSDSIILAFKAGAKWAMSQGIMATGRISSQQGGRGIVTTDVIQDLGELMVGDKVIVQIRKK